MKQRHAACVKVYVSDRLERDFGCKSLSGRFELWQLCGLVDFATAVRAEKLEPQLLARTGVLAEHRNADLFFLCEAGVVRTE